ncbi:uncharacterized protein L201_002198 [Kwoniella dendrophila CBS 6074]|uniref:BZIP domain-containing protein n=1 Tax=Kwoniella dendrophila CBS 6074 TaxID=1295534 RepID=A0AAX4JRG0_9TREE
MVDSSKGRVPYMNNLTPMDTSASNYNSKRSLDLSGSEKEGSTPKRIKSDKSITPSVEPGDIELIDLETEIARAELSEYVFLQSQNRWDDFCSFDNTIIETGGNELEGTDGKPLTMIPSIPNQRRVHNDCSFEQNIALGSVALESGETEEDLWDSVSQTPNRTDYGKLGKLEGKEQRYEPEMLREKKAKIEAENRIFDLQDDIETLMNALRHKECAIMGLAQRSTRNKREIQFLKKERRRRTRAHVAELRKLESDHSDQSTKLAHNHNLAIDKKDTYILKLLVVLLEAELVEIANNFNGNLSIMGNIAPSVEE